MPWRASWETPLAPEGKPHRQEDSPMGLALPADEPMIHP